MMQLPPRMSSVSGASGRRLCIASMGNCARRRCWQLDSTKQRPSMAMCCIVLIQLSRSSAVGAQYSATRCWYMAMRSAGM